MFSGYQWLGNPFGAGMASKSLLLFSLFLTALPVTAAQPAPKTAATLVTIDARSSVAPPETGYLRMGHAKADISPSGHVLGVNSRYLTLDGKPWLPVMGEFHFSRYPAKYWEEEILKMKAGGVQIVSTYIFWIHHEEIEGQYDWSGRRDLRKFVELCARHGMYVYPRIGPWNHGEVRNGGLPDWLLKKGPVRVNDPVYLAYVREFYGQIAKQLQGLLWKDGGPVIGIQLENEYSNRSANGGAAHILELKQLALDAGLDVPLYTVTGWDNAVFPPREVIPVFGGYPDEFWSGSLKELRPDVEGMYTFHLVPRTGSAGILQAASVSPEQHPSLKHYPKFTAELGGGMETSYHRRVAISPNDIAPMALVQLGSGTNLLGYYMFHGGTNPQGKLTTLQESQATDYPNDLPVKSYDFQAPLREFGEMNGSFRQLKVIHQFIADFGSYLAPMAPVLPAGVQSGPDNGITPRVIARTEGDHGFLFFNNYVRHYPLSEHKGVQVSLKLPDETLIVPQQPFTLASQSSFFWPVNLDMNGVTLKYATAQPFARMEDQGITYYFFMSTPDVPAEFDFAANTIATLHANGKVMRNSGHVLATGITPSTSPAIELRTSYGKIVRVMLFSPKQAQDSWKTSIDGQPHMLMTAADVFADSDTVHLLSRGNDFAIAIFPKPSGKVAASLPLRENGADGIFTLYAASGPAEKLQITADKIRDAAPASPVRMGKKFDWRPSPVATAPTDGDFNKAAVWRLESPKNALAGLSNLYVDIHYTGDVARLYQGGQLLDDNFYNGTVWEIGLKRFAPEILEKGADLEILPLRKDAPIYLPASARPKFGSKPDLVKLDFLRLVPEYELKIDFSATKN